MAKETPTRERVIKSQDYWRGYIAALEDAAQGIGQKHAPGIKDDIMQDCEALAFIAAAAANAPKEVENRADCIGYACKDWKL
jgi:hypothetical protein